MFNQDIIEELTSLWFDVVTNDHHKDRDCHWYINKVWSYGEKPFYRVEHYGYVYHPDEIAENKFKTLEGAEKYLIYHLLEAIDGEYSWNQDHINEGDQYDLYDQETVERMGVTLEKYKDYRDNKYD